MTRPAKKQKVERPAAKPAETWESNTDALLWDPHALVGKRLRVLWPAENRLFAGTVTEYHPATCQHTVTYDDGDLEKLILPTEKLQLLASCSRPVVPPNPEHLRSLAKHLDDLADRLEVKAVQGRTARGRTMLKDDQRLQLEMLRRRSAEARAAREYRLQMLVEEGRQQQDADSQAARMRGAAEGAVNLGAAASSGQLEHGKDALCDRSTPFKVCSPASAKRRRQLMQQREQGSAQEAGSAPGAWCDASTDAKSGLLGGRRLFTAAKGLWAAGQSSGGPAGTGKLYVPRAWPRVAVTVASAEAAERSAGNPQQAAEVGTSANAGAAEQEQAAHAATLHGGAMADGLGASMQDAAGPPSEHERRSADVLADELRADYARFRGASGTYKQYHELQVALWLAPEQLVGRELRVLWPDEGAWFCGKVARYDPEAGTHTVLYDDGDMEELHMAAEQVRLQLVPSDEEPLAPQHPAALRRLAESMAAGAATLQQRAQALRHSPPQGEAQAGSAEAQPGEEDPADVEAKAERWLTAAEQLQALVAVMDADGGASHDAATGAQGLHTAHQVLRPGECVWAQVRRTQPWPAIVITREEAEREGLSIRASQRAAGPPQVYVRFFGDCTCFSLPAVGAGQRIPDRGGVVPFITGIELGWHTRRSKDGDAGGAASLSAHAQRFTRALFELRTYLTEGELPRGMIPPNYDEEEDDEGDDEGSEGRAPGARGATAAVALPYAPVAFPLAVGAKLRVLLLGEVVWLSQHFHDAKAIYPLGYRAERVMASGASEGREVRHVMEVAACADGVRPVFRITPEGFPPVTADTASRAMRALFEADERASGRAPTKTGADLFGLTSMRVAALIRRLPAAERCEQYANWPEGEKPPLPPLTALEELQRQALHARALRVPAGVFPQRQAKAGMCFECEVCGEDEETPTNTKFQCDMCQSVVHAKCYGVQAGPPGSLWLCDVCKLHGAGLPADRAPLCDLCPFVGGPMKRTTAGSYVHLLCSVWTPGVTFADPVKLERVEGVAKAVASRSALLCVLCKQPHGACIQCSGDAKCFTAFHPMCAREAGLAMVELSRAASVAAASLRTEAAPPPGASGNGGSASGAGTDVGKENVAPPAMADEKAPAGAKVLSATEASKAPGALAAAAATTSAAVSAPLRRGRGRKSGTQLAAALNRGACRGGVTLGNGTILACFCARHDDAVLHEPLFRSSYPGRFAERRAELQVGQLRARLQQQLQQEEPFQQPQPSGAGAGREAAAATGRAASFEGWCSRGHRAPEALAIAHAKRGVVRKLPYLVTGRLQQAERDVEAVRAHGPTATAAHAPSACSAAADGGESGAGDDAVGGVLPGPVAAAAAAAGARSLAERYAAMRATVGQRLAAGKSAIHGWGAFAKVPHRRGDMLIEYAGELIRPILSDLRERVIYDSMVGAGTYIFALNAEQHIDATRSGNMAHLLNHSCAPNCYSRTITLVNAAGASTDHIILFAKRDIEEWEELVYDYRFSSASALPCNCGAATCRAFVNWPEAEDAGQASDDDGDAGSEEGGADDEGCAQ